MKEVKEGLIEEIVEIIRKKFELGEEDVAILLYFPELGSLKFVYPPALIDSGTIPMSSKDSLAVRVIDSKKGFISNNFQDIRHLSFFTKFTKDKRPLMKLIAVPIINKKGEPLGVIEVSRRDIAKNFSREDLLYLEQIGEILGEKLG